MDRKKVAPPVPPSAPLPSFFDANNNGTRNKSTPSTRGSISHPSKRLGSTLSKRLQKQRDENWDDGSLHALRGYAALSRDEITGATVDWKHLIRNNDRDREVELASSEIEASSVEGRSVSSRNSTMNARRRDERNMSSRDRPKFDKRGLDIVVVQEEQGRYADSRPHSPELSQAYRRPRMSARADDYDSQSDSSYRNSDASGSTRPKYQHAKSSRYRGPLHKRPISHGEASEKLPLVHAPKDSSMIRDVLEELEALRADNERLRREKDYPNEPHIPTQPAVLAFTSKVFHMIKGNPYLDEPRWEPAADGSVVLQANNPIRSLEWYLDQHPEIAFAIYKEYSEIVPANRKKLETADGTLRKPEPYSEFLSLIAPEMVEAVDEFVQKVPKFGDYFPFFNPERRIGRPYLFMYYSLPFAATVLPALDVPSRNLVDQLIMTLEKSHGYEYESARLQAKKGKVARHLIRYLIRPGDILVDNTDTESQAYVARGWIEGDEVILEELDDEEPDNINRKRIPRYGPHANSAKSRSLTVHSWEVPAWYWKFDGVFKKTETTLTLNMLVGYDEESVDIKDLTFCPIQYAAEGTRELLQKRGETFWSLRNKRFVSYLRVNDEELNNIEDRYMVDTNAYKTLHPRARLSTEDLHDSLGPLRMAQEDPPDGEALLVFPPTVMAYNLQEKTWRELFVDRITDIRWNKQAFTDLVVDPKTKELVQAVVMKQLNTAQSTDFVTGKGNGLIMLLHGAPGTGKTFTAEGVAEFAEKPLLRVTCGDVGTKAETVDKRLRATFMLGKMWDCVVLLDEADVFLEERDVRDLNRNALVSVFLRALEYYEGILILTSNRVGTFDEAFKSRIQLALHYDNLGEVQRRKIWRNFTARIKTLDHEHGIDIAEIEDNISELGKEVLNGREIRNAITIARQLAHFRKESFGYLHLKHAIDVGSQFGRYLRDLKMDMTDDAIKQVDGIRLSYTAPSEGLE